MMKSIFLFLCMAASAAMLGQNEASNGLQTQLVEAWVNGSWQNSQKGTFTTNDDGYIANVLFEQWNVGASTWEVNSQVNFTSEGNTQISTNQNWNGENWINTSRTTYFYSDGNALAESSILQSWSNGVWQNLQQTTNTYNNQGHLTHVLTETWHAESNSWDTYIQQNHSLNDDGQTSVMIAQLYNSASDTWTDFQKQTNDYTSGLLTYTLSEINPPSWINSTGTSRNYDEQERVYQTIVNIWSAATNSWNTGSRITYFYETLGTDNYSKDVLAVYPNPATDILTLSNTEPLTSVSVCAIDGRSFSFSPANNQIDVSMLPAGVYVLAAETETGRQIIKFIKQ